MCVCVWCEKLTVTTVDERTDETKRWCAKQMRGEIVSRRIGSLLEDGSLNNRADIHVANNGADIGKRAESGALSL